MSSVWLSTLPLWAGAMFAVGAMISLALGSASRRAAWASFAASHGLQLHRSRGIGWGAWGLVDGIAVNIREVSWGKHRVQVTTSVSGAPEGLTVLPQRRRLMDRPQIRTADGLFDATVRVEGPEIQVRAVLDQQMRRALVRLIHRGGSIVDGRLHLTVPTTVATATDLMPALHEALRLATQLQRRWARPRTHLHHIALDDPRLAVRHGATRALLADKARSEARELLAAQTLGGDEHPDLRLLAARVLDHADTWTVVALDPTMTPEARVEALWRLPSLDPTGEVGAQAIESTLALGLSPLSSAAVDLAAEQGHPRALLATRTLLEQLGEPEGRASWADTVVSATRAVTRWGSPADEHAIARLLGQGADDVDTALCGCLARIGTIDSVEALDELSRHGPTFGSARAMARSAIQQIQTRAGVAHQDIGRLTMATDELGKLSTTEEAGLGHLSAALDDDELPDRPIGQPVA